jgi:hypothetical protein
MVNNWFYHYCDASSHTVIDATKRMQMQKAAECKLIIHQTDVKLLASRQCDNRHLYIVPLLDMGVKSIAEQGHVWSQAGTTCLV